MFEELDLKIAEPKQEEAGYYPTIRCTNYCPRTSWDGCSTSAKYLC